MALSQNDLIAYFLNAANYPHPAGRLARYETHVSLVFLAGEFAYKIKKPVKFPFLDATRLESRRRFCELEIELNRRLAPSLYLGVEALRRDARGRLSIGGPGRAVEWMVVMRRLPEADMLHRRIARGKVSANDIREIGRQLARFFRRARRGADVNRYGEPEAIESVLMQTVEACREFEGETCRAADLRAIRRGYRRFLTLRRPLLARRVARGCIIDGHGDLRSENICLTQPAQIFDCVEFQPAFRCGDRIFDLAFLAMDLEFRGRPDLAAALIDYYRGAFRDTDAAALLPVYKCHRSLVRGIVRELAARQHPGEPAGRRARKEARRHFRLARTYADAFAKPALIVVGGMIGSGKSTVARELARAFDAAWLRTDEIRLRDFARYRTSQEGMERGIYAPAVSNKVYARLARLAEAELRGGGSAVCDGTFGRQHGRIEMRAMAARHGASFHYIECVAPEAVCLERVAARWEEGKDLSEARPETYHHLKRGYERVRGFTPGEYTRLNTNRTVASVVEAALGRLRRGWR